MTLNNKWMRAAVPALLIHCSIGTVYCWSTFKQSIADAIGMSPFAVGWAFSFAIFFLGMSAAFAGKIVELNIHRSSLISAICFTAGMLGTGLTIKFCSGVPALLLIYLFYGCIMGIGLGIGYLTPVKTLMLWFKDNKGLATGISIMGFGLAKAIATPIMEFLQKQWGITAMFMTLGCIYFVMIFTGHLLLKKPDGWVESKTTNSSFKSLSMFKNRTFIGIWLIFYINIHCGLMLITYEKQFITTKFGNASADTLAMLISVIPSITAICNALGRIGYSTISDKMKDRSSVYIIIFCTSIAACTIMLLGKRSVFVIPLLMIVNLGYGGGFSTLPALLDSRFGMENISKIHGLALSAWAVAGLTGNNLSELLLKHFNDYNVIVCVANVMYSVSLLICLRMVKLRKTTSN